MIKLSPLINELITKDLTTGSDSDTRYFMVYKSKLFIFDVDSRPGQARMALADHPEYKNINDTDDLWEFLNSAAEAGPDILVGEWYPKRQGIIIWNFSEITPQTSLQVKKAAKALGAKRITTKYIDYERGDDSVDKDISVKKAKGEMPKKMYHGTSSSELRSLLRFGLDPGRGPGRFVDRDIEHYDHVFVAGTFEGAMFYARNATMKSDQYGSYPIILELNIPDSSLLAPDYDADVTSGNSDLYYPQRAIKPSKYHTMKAMGASRETGKWGYKGRIPAQFIKWVWYYNRYLGKWRRSRPDIWRKLLDKYDFEAIAYKLGMDG